MCEGDLCVCGFEKCGRLQAGRALKSGGVLGGICGAERRGFRDFGWFRKKVGDGICDVLEEPQLAPRRVVTDCRP